MEKQVKVTSDNNKITAICGKLEFTHKFGSKEVEVREEGEKLILIMLDKPLNPLHFSIIIASIIKNIDKIKAMKETEKPNPEMDKQIQYEKIAMQYN